MKVSETTFPLGRSQLLHHEDVVVEAFLYEYLRTNYNFNTRHTGGYPQGDIPPNTGPGFYA